MPEYLICDLDECLIKTDALYEQWLSLLKTKPSLFALSLLWLLRGKTYFKNQVAKNTLMKPQLLPYRQEVIAVIKSFRAQKKGQIILASASPFPWIQAIGQHLGLFDYIVGSSEQKNLKGPEKLKAVKEIIGNKPFCYIGDHAVDLALWKESSEIIAINPSASLKNKIQGLNKPTSFIHDKTKTGKLLFKQIRPHQWVKNSLVFLPALAGHKFLAFNTLLNCFLAFMGFSLSASFVYVLNDLLDLSADRNHHTKKNRPFASGDLSIKWGLFLLPSLILGTLFFATQLPLPFTGWISCYLFFNVAYSLYLKQSVIVDVIILSMMYTLRIFAGSAASSVPVSEWLLSFSTLFFFSLACVKRYTEIIRSKNKITLDGRGYRQVDGAIIQTLGVGSGLLSILIILLYLQSNDVRSLYKNPQNLWYATPIFLFWVSRVWLLTNRDEIHDDPVVFAVKDKVSWLCFLLLGIVIGVSL
ncbi:MAG: UbiA family prenyltransferase [Bdellovibrio sp.]